VILGMVGALAASVATGVPPELPPVALSSPILLFAERAFALFSMWLVAAVVLGRALSNQLPVEVSTRGVRYAEAERAQATADRTEDLIRDMETDMRWLRRTVRQLMQRSDVAQERSRDGS
jgi:hypothetical protein